MNEREIEAKLTSYRDQLGTCSRRPVSRRRLWPAALVAGAVALVVAAVSLRPQDATAAALERIAKAIKNAQTMEATLELLKADGKTWHQFQHLFYENGKWRLTVHQGWSLERTLILTGGQVYTTYKNLGHATVEPEDPSFYAMFYGDEVSAIDFVKQQIDIGEVSSQREIKIVQSPPANGRQTYRILMERASGYRAEIVVDKETDLPIRASVEVPDHGYGPNYSRHFYRFNHALPPNTFTYEEGKALLDLTVEQGKLATKWKKPIATFEDTDVLDACVTDDGAIWIVVAVEKGAKWSTLPRRILGGHPSGYAHLNDIRASEILAKTSPFSIGGKQVVVVPFMPLADGPTSGVPVSLGFDRAVKYTAGDLAPEAPSSPREGSLALNLRKVRGDRPEYFTALDLDRYGFMLSLLKFKARANELERMEHWKAAAEAHELAAKAYAGFVKFAGFKSLDAAAKCYLKAGLPDEAKRCEEESRTLRLSRAR